MKALAAVAVAPGKVEFQAVRVPEPGADDVAIRVTHSWISNGTEGSFVRGERSAGDTPRSENDPLPFPHIPGYQKVGVVEQIGSKIRDLAVGETVFATVSRVEEMFYDHGGHVSPAVTHRSQVWKLPTNIEPVAFSGLVLAQVGYNTAMRPTVQQNDKVVVIGDGLVGHWTAQTLQSRGAKVTLVGRHHARLNKFTLREGDMLVNEKLQDVTQIAGGWAPGGVQAVCDTVGTVELLENLIPLIRRNGHISSAGFYGPNGRLDIQKLRDRELTLQAPSGWTTPRMDATLQMIARGELQTLPLITHRFPASRAGEAFDLILSRPTPVLGVVLEWDA